MKTLAVKMLVALQLVNPHYVHFTWHQSSPGKVTISCGSVSGGPYTFPACSNSKKPQCNSHKFTSGGTYFCIATENMVLGESNEVTFISK